MRRSRLIPLAFFVLFAACGPGADNNGNNGGTNNGGTNNGGTNNGGTNNGGTNNGGTNNGEVSFSSDIAPLVLSTCNVAFCHAAPGNAGFSIDGGDAAAVQAAWDGIDATSSTQKLILPGDAIQSEVYIRISGAARTQMPLGGALDQSEVAMFQEWIKAGAPYDN